MTVVVSHYSNAGSGFLTHSAKIAAVELT